MTIECDKDGNVVNGAQPHFFVNSTQKGADGQKDSKRVLEVSMNRAQAQYAQALQALGYNKDERGARTATFNAWGYENPNGWDVDMSERDASEKRKADEAKQKAATAEFIHNMEVENRNFAANREDAARNYALKLMKLTQAAKPKDPQQFNEWVQKLPKEALNAYLTQGTPMLDENGKPMLNDMGEPIMQAATPEQIEQRMRTLYEAAVGQPPPTQLPPEVAARREELVKGIAKDKGDASRAARGNTPPSPPSPKPEEVEEAEPEEVEEAEEDEETSEEEVEEAEEDEASEDTAPSEETGNVDDGNKIEMSAQSLIGLSKPTPPQKPLPPLDVTASSSPSSSEPAKENLSKKDLNAKGVAYSKARKKWGKFTKEVMSGWDTIEKNDPRFKEVSQVMRMAYAKNLRGEELSADEKMALATFNSLKQDKDGRKKAHDDWEFDMSQRELAKENGKTFYYRRDGKRYSTNDKLDEEEPINYKSGFDDLVDDVSKFNDKVFTIEAFKKGGVDISDPDHPLYEKTAAEKRKEVRAKYPESDLSDEDADLVYYLEDTTVRPYDPKRKTK